VEGTGRKEGGVTSLYIGGKQTDSRSIDRNNAGADSHVAIRDETLHRVAR
jgi:hypothetical protein